MRRLAALLVVLAISYVVRTLAGTATLGTRSTALALGFALIAAALAGTLVEKVKLPRLSGYLLFGLACGPYVADIISRPMARELQLINGLAIALIAFIAGLELNFQRLRARVQVLLRVGLTTIAIMFVGLLILFWFAWPWLPLAPEMTGVTRLAAVAIVATLVVSYSPTITIAVIAESRARGPLSEIVLAVTVMADLVLILVFALAMQLLRWASGGAATGDVSLLISLAWEIPGSLAFGAALGSLFALYLRYVGRELTIVLIGLCAIVTGVGHRLHFDPLLAALAAGLVVENIAPPRGDALKEAVERGALPVLVIFFAAAGASLPLDALADIGLLAVVVAGIRLGLARAGTMLGSRSLNLEPRLRSLLWMGLISQAGVSIGLTLVVAAEFPDWGARLQTFMIALTALHTLVGPILFRASLVAAGEIGLMDRPAQG